jgi:hypothetical protein
MYGSFVQISESYKSFLSFVIWSASNSNSKLTNIESEQEILSIFIFYRKVKSNKK